MLTKKDRTSKAWKETEAALTRFMEAEAYSAIRLIPDLAEQIREAAPFAKIVTFSGLADSREGLLAASAVIADVADKVAVLRASGALPPVQLRWLPPSWADVVPHMGLTVTSLGNGDLKLPEGAVVQVRLSALVREPASLVRPVDLSIVQEYRDALDAGGNLPPVQITYDGTTIRLPNGQHRAEARHLRGEEWVAAVYHRGGMHEAVLLAAKSDVNVGLRRTRDDKRRVVGLLLADDEYKAWPSTRIAKLTGTSHTFVDTLKDKNGVARKKKPRELPKKESKPETPSPPVPVSPETAQTGANNDEERQPAEPPSPSTLPRSGPDKLEPAGPPEAPRAPDPPPKSDPDCNVAVRTNPNASLTVETILEQVHRLSPEDQTRLWTHSPAPIVLTASRPHKDKKGLWNAVEGTIRRHMEAALEEVAGRLDYEFGDRIAAHYFRGHDAENLLRHMLIAQRALFDVEIPRLRGLLREVPGLGLLSKPPAIYAACKTLGIPVPRKGHIDMDRARRAMRTLVAELHPDRNGGQRLHEGRYQEVVEAYAAIRTYAAKIQVRTNEVST